MAYFDEMASLHVVKGRKQKKDGRRWDHWILRGSRYVPEAGAMAPVYIGYVGADLEIDEDKAKALAAQASEKLGEAVTVDDIRNVNRLKIVESAENES